MFIAAARKFILQTTKGGCDLLGKMSWVSKLIISYVVLMLIGSVYEVKSNSSCLLAFLFVCFGYVSG